MNPTTSDSQSVLGAVQRACDKRGVAEIEIEWLDGERQCGRMRLIDWDEHALYIDRPTYHGMPLELASDLPAIVHFLVDGERFSFRTRIIEECRVRLGDNETIAGFSLHTPDEVHRDERRNDFRVSLGKCAEVVCEARPLQADQHRRSRLDPLRGRSGSGFSARVMNISAGGMAVIAVDLNGYQPRCGDAFEIEFSLPGVERRFAFNAELSHLRELSPTLSSDEASGAGFVMGLKFLPDTNAAKMRQAVRQISQFVAKLLKKQ